MVYDYSALLCRVKDKFGSQAAFSKAMNISEHTISVKFNNKKEWKQNEIMHVCRVLDIPIKDIPIYFFAGDKNQIEEPPANFKPVTLENFAVPLKEYLNDNYHCQCAVIITADNVKVVEIQESVPLPDNVIAGHN